MDVFNPVQSYLTCVLFNAQNGAQFYKCRFEKEENDLSYTQKLILDRMNDLEKNQ